MANPSVTQEISLIEKAYFQYLKRNMIIASDQAKQTLLDNRNYATNTLKQSISGGAEIFGDTIIGSFGANTKYAEAVETGKGGKPTYQAILEWVQRKVRLGHIDIEPKRIRSFAFLTARKINESGKTTNTKPYLMPAYKQLMARFETETPLEIP